MLGFHSLPLDLETVVGAENPFPCWLDAKMDALPSRQPCQVTQTFPLESVAAAGSTSDPGELEMRTVAPGFPFSTTRAQMSKFDSAFADQNTHGRPFPSIATVGR